MVEVWKKIKRNSKILKRWKLGIQKVSLQKKIHEHNHKFVLTSNNEFICNIKSIDFWFCNIIWFCIILYEISFLSLSSYNVFIYFSRIEE